MKFILVYIIALVVLSVNVAGKKKSSEKSENVCDGQVRSNGTQIPSGSCSTTIQGQIPSSDKMPSTLIISPENGAVLKPNTKFSVDIAMINMVTGHFSDPEKQYNIAPQTLKHGLILGHTHVTIQELKGKTPPDAKEFAFFKGINDKASSDGLLTVDVVSEDGKQPGLSPGDYRICTMAGSFSHQAPVMPVAKRGSQDDCIRIKVGSKK